MIYSAKVAHLARRAANFGVDTGDFRVDLAAVVARKGRGVAGIRGGSERAELVTACGDTRILLLERLNPIDK